jgi:membrane protease YdiL (CAAX protease family)
VERQRLAAVVVALGVGLFGVAIAAREELNPWWTNAGVAVFVLAGSAGVLRQRLPSLFEVRWSSLGGAVLVGAAMVAATHLCFEVATGLIPGLEHTVDGLYGDVGEQSPGQIGSVVLIVLVVVAEEALWRGVAVELCVSRLGRAWTGVAVVLLYAVPQLIGGDWVLLAAAVGAGTIFTVQRLITGNLLAPIATHAMWSVCIFSLIPLS